MFNGGIRGKRATDNQGTVNPQNKFIQTKYPQPYISGYAVSGLDDTALDPAGGQTVLVNGTGFATGVSATLAGTQISAVTLVSPTQISFTAPAKSSGSYTLVVYNSTGGAAILVPGLTYSGIPTYSTAAGSIGSVYETNSISTSVTATSDSSITYSLSSGSLPSGASLNTSTGAITGTAPADSGSTTYTFAITAIDAELQDVTRTFTLTVNTDVVTWSNPSSGASISLDGTAYSTSLSATSAAGKTVSYTANALPTGLTLSSGTISGTPTVEGSTTTLLTATAATTGRTSTNTITWTVALGDSYWKYTTLLLNAATPTTSFINDASLNNSQLTIAGDTKPNNFNPYTQGYYSFYASTNGSYYSYTDNSAFGTGDFTVEWWGRTDSASTNWIVNGGAASNWQIVTYLDGFYWQENGGNLGSMGFTVAKNRWMHFAISRTGGFLNVYIDGVRQYNAANTYNYSATGSRTIGQGAGGTSGSVWMSNLRIIKGTGIYSGTTISVPTSPLTSISNTVLLTCQSRQMIDNGPINYAFTATGSPQISSAHPFTTPTTAAYNTLYSTYFDGSGDYLTTPSFSLTLATWTMEFWLNTTSTTQYQTFVHRGNGATWSVSSIWDIYQTGTTSSSLTFLNGTGGVTLAGTTVINNGTWHHIAVTYDGTNYRLFIDGKLEAYQAGSAMSTASYLFYIGYDPRNTRYTTGNISNFRFVDGSVVYSTSSTTTGTTIFTPPTTSLTAVANTVLLTCQNATFIDNSTNAFAITSNGDAKPIALSPFTMTTSNTTVTSLGSAYFDGTGDYLSTPGTAAFMFGTGDFTIEGWIYTTGTSGTLFDNRTGTSSTHVVIYNNAGALQYYVGGAGLINSSTLPLGAWNHIALVRISGSTKMYLNGVQTGSTAADTNNFSTSGTVLTGAGLSGANLLTGYIADFRVIKGTGLYTANFLPPQTPLTAVTNTQLLTLQYNGGATNYGIYDNSSFSNIVSRSGNATQGAYSPYSQNGWSTYFGGSDYLNITSSSGQMDTGSGDFTTEMWFYWNNMPTTGYQNICGNGNIAGTYGLMTGNTASNTWSAPYVFKLNVASSGDVLNGNTTLVAGQWYHLAHTRTSGVNRLFVNGVLQTNTYSDSTSRPYGSGGAFLIGQNSNGYVSNFRYVKGTSLYTATFTPSTTPLDAVTNTQLLTCNMNRFTDSSSNNLTMAVSGTPTTQAFSPFGGVTSAPTSYSVYFDGTSDVYTINGNAGPIGTEDFTFEFWAYITTMGGQYPRIFESATSVSGSFQVYLDGGTLVVGGNGTGTVTSYSISAFTNQWLHLCVTRTGSAMRLFVNGTLRGYSGSGGTNFASGGTTWRSMTEGGGLIGYLSNMRVVRGSIVSAYSTSTTTTGTSVFSAPTSPLTAISGTQFLGMQSATMLDNSSNNYTVSVTGDTKVRPLNPFGLTTTSSVSYSPSTHGGSIYFDGDSTGGKDYIQINGTSIYNFNTGDFTAESWIFYITRNLNAALPVIQNTDYGGTGWALNLETNMTLSFNISGTNVLVTTATVPTNVWCHVAVSRYSGTLKLFINGVQSASVSYATSIAPASPYLRIGADSTASFLIKAYQSDVRIVTGTSLYTSSFYPPVAPLTATPNTVVLLNFTSGGIIDRHSTGILESAGNTQLASEDPYGGSYYSNYFNGSTDYLTVPDNAAFAFGTGDFTIEYWMYATTLPAIAYYLYGQCDASATAASRAVYDALGSDGIITTQVYYNTSSSVSITSSSTQAVGIWYHIAIVRDGTTIRQYINGVQRGTGSISTGTVNDSTTVFAVGRLGAYTSNPFLGYISNFRVVKGTCLYPSGTTFTPSTTPLTAVANTQLLTCQSNKFIDNSSNAFTVTASGTPSVKSKNPFQQNTGKSLYFDGTGDYLYAANSTNFAFGTGDFTVEFWFYPLVINLTNNPILDTRTGSGSGSGLLIRLGDGGSSNPTYVYAVVGTTTIYQTGLVANQWQHIAVTRASSSCKVWINGSAGTAGTSTQDLTNGGLLISKFIDSGNAINGYIKDFRITKGYARTISVPTSTLRTN